MRKYYEAYEDRYLQVHEKNLQWASDAPSPAVMQTIEKYHIRPTASILELGCGEGRDAIALLQKGYGVTATDISPEAIRHCRQKLPEYTFRFQVLDCIGGSLEKRYDFIYAIALVHMLVNDDDRAGFYRFIRDHLKDDAIALVCTMGDGTISRKSDTATAFDLQERVHSLSGKKMLLAGTSCSMVTWDTFLAEIRSSGMTILDHGLTEAPPDFPVMMYAVISKKLH